MKRNISIFLSVLLLVLVLLPVNSNAKSYTLKDTDISISVDDSIWYVFTRENILNNPELAELGISYDYIYEFVTVVNKDNYTLTFQSNTAFSDWEYEEMNKIANSITFQVDSSLKEPSGKSSDGIVSGAIRGAIVGGIAGGIGAFIGKRKKKEKEKKNEETPTCTGPDLD